MKSLQLQPVFKEDSDVGFGAARAVRGQSRPVDVLTARSPSGPRQAVGHLAAGQSVSQSVSQSIEQRSYFLFLCCGCWLFVFQVLICLMVWTLRQILRNTSWLRNISSVQVQVCVCVCVCSWCCLFTCWGGATSCRSSRAETLPVRPDQTPPSPGTDQYPARTCSNTHRQCTHPHTHAPTHTLTQTHT